MYCIIGSELCPFLFFVRNTLIEEKESEDYVLIDINYLTLSSLNIMEDHHKQQNDELSSSPEDWSK